MLDFLLFLYICYGLYFAGKHAPYGTEVEDKNDITSVLLIFILVAIAWPAAKGFLKNDYYRDKEDA